MLAINVIAKAQEATKSPEQRAGHLTKALQRQLNLTADQSTQINAVFLAQATRVDSLKANLSGDKKSDGYARRSIMLSAQQQILSVLNEDQKKQFLQFEKMRKEKQAEKKAKTQTAQG